MNFETGIDLMRHALSWSPAILLLLSLAAWIVSKLHDMQADILTNRMLTLMHANSPGYLLAGVRKARKVGLGLWWDRVSAVLFWAAIASLIALVLMRS